MPTQRDNAGNRNKRSPVVEPSKPRFLEVLGPGLITGASDDDPSGIATYSQVGARFAYGATWTLLFILCLQEVSSSILLYTSRTTVLSVAMFDLWEAGNVNALAALGVLQLAVSFAVLLLVSRYRLRGVAA